MSDSARKPGISIDLNILKGRGGPIPAIDFNGLQYLGSHMAARGPSHDRLWRAGLSGPGSDSGTSLAGLN